VGVAQVSGEHPPDPGINPGKAEGEARLSKVRRIVGGVAERQGGRRNPGVLIEETARRAADHGEGARNSQGQVALDVELSAYGPRAEGARDRFEREGDQLLREVFEKNVAIRGWRLLPPQSGHLNSPFSRSLKVRVSETSFLHFPQ
jgi:hypothetical protein